MALAYDFSSAGGMSQATADGRYEKKDVVQNASPIAGATVNITEGGDDLLLNLTPASTLASLTVTLPSDGSTRIGQIIRVYTSQTITALTINGATTIRDNVTTLLGQDAVAFQKIAANTWGRV